jgi:hypothetical protein
LRTSRRKPPRRRPSPPPPRPTTSASALPPRVFPARFAIPPSRHKKKNVTNISKVVKTTKTTKKACQENTDVPLGYNYIKLDLENGTTKRPEVSSAPKLRYMREIGKGLGGWKHPRETTLARAPKLRYFLTPEQLSEVIESHADNHQPHEWVKGDFAFADVGEAIPAGSLEISIKVPSGFDFLVFPAVLKVEGGVDEEEMGEQEEQDEEVESSDSELSECGYVSDVRA